MHTQHQQHRLSNILPRLVVQRGNIEKWKTIHCDHCHKQYRETQQVINLPNCEHTFHHHCLDKIIDDTFTCLICEKHLFIEQQITENIKLGTSNITHNSSPSFLHLMLEHYSIYNYEMNRVNKPKLMMHIPQIVNANLDIYKKYMPRSPSKS